MLTTHPLTVAPRQQIVMLNERHPSDLVFLPNVDHLDSGYVFLTQEYDRHVVTCYRWDPAAQLVLPVGQGRGTRRVQLRLAS